MHDLNFFFRMFNLDASLESLLYCVQHRPWHYRKVATRHAFCPKCGTRSLVFSCLGSMCATNDASQTTPTKLLTLKKNERVNF